MFNNHYDLSDAEVVGVSVKDPEKEKEKRIADEKFRNATPEERQMLAYEDAHKNEETVTLTDDAGKPAVFRFFDETYIPLDDEEGITTVFECISSMEYDGAVYYALLPEATEDEEEPEEFVVLRGEESEDELLLESLDDDEEYQRVGELFLKALFQLEGMPEDDDNLQ